MNGGMLRIGIVIMGVVLVIISFWKYSAKKLAVNYGVIWVLQGILMILLGTVPGLSGWTYLLSPETGLTAFCVGFLVIALELQSSLTISQLTFKDREMAMHLALLNQESEWVMDEVKELINAQEDRRENGSEKDSVRG